jgi:O-antigen ligase/tRNA A-37 threonylcarbamoyl transferase component Bud32
MPFSRINTSAPRVFDFICLWVLPLGFFLLFCGLFFLPTRGTHQKLYYALVSAPALIALCIRPGEFKILLKEPLVQAFLLFAGWALLSLNWSPSPESVMSLAKPPLYIFMLFAGASLLLRHRAESLKLVFLAAALVALVASVFNLYVFLSHYAPDDRMVGGGAFDNPLLSSHLFGFFCTYWFFLGMTVRNPKLLLGIVPAFLIMFAAVLATSSRTPLVAIAMAGLWLAFICWNRRSLLLLTLMAVTGASMLVIFPDMILARGDSYRFEIWDQALHLIADAPWIGHGYDATLSIDPGVGYPFREPHNFALGVLFYVGIIGFLPWLAMQLRGLFDCWRQRSQSLFILASSLMVFGIGASLTEGGDILYTPREHWFLLWIPLALMAALSIARRTNRLPELPVRSLAANDARQVTANAQVVEKDGLGPKVLKLEDGSFLKLFRARRWYTLGSFHPYSERFAENSQRLARTGLSTPAILELYHMPNGDGAVRYQPLSGRTLRQVLQAMTSVSIRQALVERFGRFLAELHERGIYFRSLHLGNVILLEDGEFGLMNVADLRLLPSPLSLGLRRRNLRHLQRSTEDRRWLDAHFTDLLAGYAVLAPDSAVQDMHKQVHALGLAS